MVKKYPDVNIVNFDKLDYCSCLANLEEIKDAPNYKFVKGDICSPDLVNHILATEKIDTIVHFAAQTHVDNSFGNSFAFSRNNIYGTHVLLESAKQANIKRFVHCSTDEVYGEGEIDGAPMGEEHVLEPTNPYAATKAAAEFLVKSYNRSFNLPVIITRGNNVYGPHQYPEKLIPKFINQLRTGRSLTVHGNGENMRNFLYVEDVARAFETVLRRAEVGKVYNIGGSNELTVMQVTDRLLEVMGKTAEKDRLVTFVPDRAFNDLRYTVRADRLHELGWEEKMPFDEGLRRTVEWYTAHSGRYGNIAAALEAHPLAGSDALESGKGDKW